MESWQQTIVILLAFINIIFFFKAYYEITRNKNAFGLTHHLFFLGSYVWGDMIVLGPFWILASGISLILSDWYLFLLIISVFWVARSLGETIYWIAEQFSAKNRNAPQTLRFYKLFKSDAVWFVYQLINQCILVASIIFSIYFAKLWLAGI
jgi:hypothetical protein